MRNIIGALGVVASLAGSGCVSAPETTESSQSPHHCVEGTRLVRGRLDPTDPSTERESCLSDLVADVDDLRRQCSRSARKVFVDFEGGPDEHWCCRGTETK